MARNITSREEKSIVRRQVEMEIGPTDQGKKRRTDWRVSRDGLVSFFLTFSKASQLFYDVNGDDLEEWSSYARAFVIFVRGRADDALIVPVKDMDEQLRIHHRPSEGGNYKQSCWCVWRS